MRQNIFRNVNVFSEGRFSFRTEKVDKCIEIYFQLKKRLSNKFGYPGSICNISKSLDFIKYKPFPCVKPFFSRQLNIQILSYFFHFFSIFHYEFGFNEILRYLKIRSLINLSTWAGLYTFLLDNNVTKVKTYRDILRETK